MRNVLGLTAPPRPPTRRVRWTVLGVLVVFLGAGLLHPGPSERIAALGAALAAVSGAVSTLGPARPRVPAAVLAAAGVAVVGHGAASCVGWFGLCTLASWIAGTEGPAILLAYWAAALALMVVELTAIEVDSGWVAWMAGTTVSVGASVFARRQHILVTQLRDAQAGLAARAQAEERNRIARELHDVIAHSLTVSLLHVSSARLAVADAPEDAARSLAEAERLGRASLDEVRHAVGLLRDPGAPDPATPLPGSTDLPTLLAGFRAAGTELRAQVADGFAALPATVGLIVYRIVQEALTNAAKHAPSAPVVVDVGIDPDEVTVDVQSAAAPPPGTGPGLGLVGMRERAESVGGTCTAAPGGLGWRVHAVLPLAPRPAA